MPALLIGTLDTKGAEIAFVRDWLHAADQGTLVLDAGVLGPPTCTPDVARETVFAAAGVSLESVRRGGDRGQAIEAAARGAAKIAAEYFANGRLDGVLGLGGSAGTAIATAAMRALPFGIPKIMVSTMASGQVRPYVGVRDIAMMHSVVDLCGLNRVSRSVLTRAAGALVGMIRANAVAPARVGEKPLVGATMFGVTTPCVEEARRCVEAAGFEVLVFHATGTGGSTLEAFVNDGLFVGVLDLTTTELADELVGGVLSAGPDRLTAAALRGVPQVIAPGALDMVNFGPPETVPERCAGRRFIRHNPSVTLVRTTPEENDRLGREIAHKASAAHGPVAVLLPLQGVSAIDRAGQPFWWPEADQALFQSIRNWIGPQVQLVELDMHINDPEFAQTAARTLLAMISGATLP